MNIIDTHAHIDQLEDLAGALQRAHEAGVSDIVAVSVDLDSMKKVLAIAGQCPKPKIHPALGVHPGMVKPQLQQPAFDFMRAHIKQARAVGETGLDYWYKASRQDQLERRKQKDSFAFHLALACEFDLPIVIHSRGAWRDCFSMARAAAVKRALFHWYSGPVDILDQIIEAGFYVSTGPSVAYSPQSRQAMAHAPLERILVETDSPTNYPLMPSTPLGRTLMPSTPLGRTLMPSTPLGRREGEASFRAEPKDVIRALAALAQLKNLDEQEALAAVNGNAKTFFGI